MALDERALFNDKSETRQGRFACPKCKRSNDYTIRWVRRTKKDRLPPGADDVDRAKFAKLRDYLLRLDDDVTCKTCGKKFEIPSQQSMVYADQLAGLPNDEELDREIAAASGEPDPGPPPAAKPAAPNKPPLSDRFTGKSSGWK
jgi:DNA-directed RNA polymerase subunit M/transcription elongation factor TFIIS